MTKASSCNETHNKVKFTISENRSAVSFVNNNAYTVIQHKVDDCLIKSGLRCDFMLSINDINTSILIELKGCDVEHALKQLEATHKTLSGKMLGKKIWMVISRRCPLASSQIQVVSRKIRANFNSTLVVKNSPHTHSI